MRIIGGYLKGKKLYQPLDSKTRPLKDLVKETIFNILAHSKDNKMDLNNANILDLFSGSGSFGIECLSRGAEVVYFLENYKDILKILNKNISNLNLDKKAKIIEKNVLNLKSINFDQIKFEIIFIDPPFRYENLNELIDEISLSKITKPETVLIIHRNKKTKEKINQKFLISREKIFGLSKLLFGKII